MTPPKTGSEYLDLALKSGVLDKPTFQRQFPDGAALPQDPQELASAFIKSKLLTAFQAKQLLTGRSRGFILGRCKILKPIGHGGMGSVYLAEDTKLKRQVAVKILPADKAKDKLSLERFLREARTAAALDHRNIVRVHDVSEGGGVQYIVMEYVDGTDLQSFLAKTGPLHYAQAAQYIAQAAEGLQHAHEAGFVHRDLKPANLMLTKDATIKILDLGLARSIVDEDDNVTGLLGDATEAAGTVDYASPEQALNQPVDGRSDIYSLGATFYSLLTGHPPFTGNTTQKLLAHQTQNPSNLAKMRETMPPQLVDVVEKMMEKSPKDRHQTAAELLEDLRPWSSGSGKLSRVDGTEAPTRRSLRPSSEENDPSDDFETPTRPKNSTRNLPVGSSAKPKWPLLVGGGVAALAAVLAAYFLWPDSTKAGKPSTAGNPTVAQQPATVPQPPEPVTPTPKPVPPKPKLRTLAGIDFKSLQPLTIRRAFRKEMSTEGSGKLPEGWEFYGSRGNVVAQYSLQSADGVNTITFQKHAGPGDGSAILYTAATVTLQEGRKYSLHIEYRSDLKTDAGVEFRQDAISKYDMLGFQFPLPPTGDRWVKQELPVVAIKNAKYVIALVVNENSTKTGLHIRHIAFGEELP